MKTNRLLTAVEWAPETLTNEHILKANFTIMKLSSTLQYEGVSKSFRTGRLERELQMVQLSATKCSYIAILWVSLVSFAAMTLFVASQWVFIVVFISLRLSPETFGYTLYIFPLHSLC
jgi:hypothetical protein